MRTSVYVEHPVFIPYSYFDVVILGLVSIIESAGVSSYRFLRGGVILAEGAGKVAGATTIFLYTVVVGITFAYASIAGDELSDFLRGWSDFKPASKFLKVTKCMGIHLRGYTTKEYVYGAFPLLKDKICCKDLFNSSLFQSLDTFQLASKNEFIHGTKLEGFEFDCKSSVYNDEKDFGKDFYREEKW